MDVRLFLLVSLSSVGWTSAIKDLPCHFFDSKNITGGIKQSDDSIIFDGIIYPNDQYATVNYELNKGKNTVVTPYIRGCTCNIKPCLRLCCPLGKIHKKENGTMVCRDHEAARNFKSEVLHDNNETKILNLDDHFAYVDGHPCKTMYIEDDYQITHVRVFVTNNK